MRVLYARRVRAGSLDLDLPEALVDLSDEGRSVGVRLLAAQRRAPADRGAHARGQPRRRRATCATRASRFPTASTSRPTPRRHRRAQRAASAPFGLRVDYDDAVAPAPTCSACSTASQGHRLARVLSRQVLRALRQARYSTANAGHFGLAFPIYCHFTSPIRRYPDLLVHRQLGRLLDGDAERRARRRRAHRGRQRRAARSAEREAMEAERAMLDLKKAEFMLEHLLEPEPATVVSVTNVRRLRRARRLSDRRPGARRGSAGDRYAFIDEERAERRFLWGLCYRMTGNAADADDLVQETFVRAMEHPPARPRAVAPLAGARGDEPRARLACGAGAGAATPGRGCRRRSRRGGGRAAVLRARRASAASRPRAATSCWRACRTPSSWRSRR